MSTSRMYPNDRPDLVIEKTGGAKLGSSYYSTLYRVVSTRVLTAGQIANLRSAGLLGSGQEFSCVQILEGGKKIGLLPEGASHIERFSAPPSGHDEVQCKEINDHTGEVIRSPSINPYTGKPDRSIKIPFYVYECEDRSDSSD